MVKVGTLVLFLTLEDIIEHLQLSLEQRRVINRKINFVNLNLYLPLQRQPSLELIG